MSKKIQVTRSSMPPYEEYCAEIKDIWENRWLTNDGAKHQELEAELKKLFGVNGVQLFSNGHLALELALSVLKLNGEVITTPFTFASTTQAILRNGLKPVFCDVDSETYCIDPEKLEALITEKTCAILPVHVYGNICEHSAIEKIAKKHKLKVIYDAAHAFGESVDDRSVAALGDMSMFSFHATKVFHTVEGGCISFNDMSYDKELKAARQFGMYGKEDAETVGANAKMTEFHAAMGLCNLRHLDEYMSARRKCVERYRDRLSGAKGVKLCPIQKNVVSNYAYFPVVFEPEEKSEDRDAVAERLARSDIFARKYFSPLTSDFSICRSLYQINETPIAKHIAENVLTLPLYSELSTNDVDRICDIILHNS